MYVHIYIYIYICDCGHTSTDHLLIETFVQGLD